MDRSIVPSFLSTEGASNYYGGDMFNNNELRMGEVQEIIDPTDIRSVSKKFNEYSVFVEHTANGTAVTKMYEHCMLINEFGSLADSLVFTLRTDPSAIRGKGPGLGAKVVILCINGAGHAPLIIGGVRDTKDKNDLKAGHHLDFVFNGVAIGIDNDGQLSLKVQGATDLKGVPHNDSLPTSLTIDKTGTLEISTKGGESTVTVNQDGTIAIQGKKSVTSNVGSNKMVIEDGKITIESPEVEINASGDVKVSAGGKATIDAPIIELGAGTAGNPLAGVVLGAHLDSLSGLPFSVSGGVSLTVTCKP